MSGSTSESATSATSLARSSAVMASGTLVSRILGLLRMALLAWAIGVITPAANIWQTANTIPNTIYLLLAAGVLNVLLLPQLTRAMTRGKEGQDYSDRLITLSVVILVIGTVIFVLAAPLAAKLTMLSLPWGHPSLDLAILFAYLCIPQMLFYGLHTLLGQILAAHHKFAAFSWSPALANVIAIAGIALFAWLYPQTRPTEDVPAIPPEQWTGPMIWLLAGSATLSIVVQALVLFPAVRATGFRWRFRWGFRGVGLGTASVMAGWALADIGVAQTGVLVATNLLNRATDLVPDAAGKAAYDLAFAIFILPHSLIAMSLLTTIYPVLSKAAAAGDRRGMAAQAATGLRMLGTAMVPLAVGMLLLAPLLARVLYPGNPGSHGAIANILIALVLGLVPYGVYLLCARVFYSMENARTPFLFQVSITTVFLLACLVAFFQDAAHVAVLIAGGQAAGQLTAAVLGLLAVRRHLPSIGLRAIASTYLRAAAAAVVALLPAWAVVRLLDRPGFLWAAITLGVAGVVFVAVYAVLAHLFGVRELATVAAPLLRRVPALQRVVGSAPPRAPQVETVPADGTLGLDEPVTRAERKDGDMDRLEAGTLLGERYALDELLARREGGTLDYWSAHDTILDRIVAVTVLPATGEHEQIAEAVLDGARRVASIDDPRLVRVLDVGTEGGMAWIVEEGLTDADSLASLVADDPLPAEEARRLVGESAGALESARRRGLHHLYLNPHAVLRTADGTVKVSGVGVASALEGTDDVTATEASLIDTADLVSLLYTALTGAWPGEDVEGLKTARRLEDGSYAAPSEVVPGVPGDLDALCRTLLGPEEDLSSAPRTPGELAHQLGPWASDPVGNDDPTTAVPTAGSAQGDQGETGDDSFFPRRDGATDDDPTGPGARPRAADLLGIRSTGERPAPRPRRDPDVAPMAAGAGEGRPVPPTTDGRYGLQEARGTGGQTLMVLLIVLGIIGLVAVLGWSVLRGLGGDGSDTDTAASPGAAATTDPSDQTSGPASTGEPTSDPSDDEEGEEPSTPAAAAGPVSILGITSYDPQGDGDERNDLTPLAVDGDPETAWTSHTYLSPGWGGLKEGTGLILDLGEEASVSEVDVTLGEGDMGVTAYLGQRPTMSEAVELGSSEEASGTWEVRPESAQTGRYLILWFDRAHTTDAGEIVSVAEIAVR